MTGAASSSTITRHPIRGAIWGIVAGIGLALLLASFAVIAIGTLAPIVVIVLVAALGVAWGMFAPPKGGAARSASTGQVPVED